MRHVAYLAILAFLTLGCSDDDVSPVEQTIGIAGDWYLINVNGTLSGINEDIEKGTVVWSFNEFDESVTVVNNVEDFELLWLLESGTYSFDIVPGNTVNTITINDINYGNLNIGTEQLEFDQRAVDGVQMIFRR